MIIIIKKEYTHKKSSPAGLDGFGMRFYMNIYRAKHQGGNWTKMFIFVSTNNSKYPTAFEENSLSLYLLPPLSKQDSYISFFIYRPLKALIVLHRKINHLTNELKTFKNVFQGKGSIFLYLIKAKLIFYLLTPLTCWFSANINLLFLPFFMKMQFSYNILINNNKNIYLVYTDFLLLMSMDCVLSNSTWNLTWSVMEGLHSNYHYHQVSL